jgi:hypothetical protein
MLFAFLFGFAGQLQQLALPVLDVLALFLA